MVKITILGSGTCASHFLAQAKLRHPPAFLVQTAASALLLDCSEAVRMRIEQVGFDFSKIEHVALSHAHPDHCAIVHFIQSQFCKGLFGGDQFRNETLNIYCPDQIASEFDQLWNFHQPDWRDQRYPFPHLNFYPMTTHADETKTAAFGDVILEGISVKHGRNDLVDALGFRVTVPSGVLAYSGDSRDCDGLRRVASGADLFICEATAGVGLDDFAHKTGHLTPFLAGRVAADVGVRKIVLVHYTGADSPGAMTEDCRRSGFSGEIHIGDDFDVMEL